MAKARWNGATIAESDETLIVEGNHYFPAGSVNRSFVTDSSTRTRCSWKGTARYFDLVVEGQVNRDAAWYYPDPKRAARQIKDYVAFWRGVQVDA